MALILVYLIVHFGINQSDDDIKKLADKVASYGLKIGSLVAPIWPPDGGSAMGSAEERKRFVEQVRKSCHVAKLLREIGIRPYGVVRIDSAGNPESWLKDPVNNTALDCANFSRSL